MARACRPPTNTEALHAALAERIMILDGAMGTEIQALGLAEEDFRGGAFADHPGELKGNNDLLCLTQPAAIEAIHRRYLEAGADIVETNSFNATAISQQDYGLQDQAYALNFAAAGIARAAADAATANEPGRPRFVAGALGPTSKTASISPEVNDPGYRAVTFDTLCAAYGEAARGLLDGGVDLLLVETVFDTLNAKAALFAIDELFEHEGRTLPVIVSGTITDLSGRTLSGQTVEAFWYSLRHARPLAVGLNCALGAAQLRPYLADLARIADCAVCVYPNAGLPNQFGEYDEAPGTTAGELRDWAEAGLLNIVGGCCGTSPAHIAALDAALAGLPPRVAPRHEPRLRLSGLEPAEIAG